MFWQTMAMASPTATTTVNAPNLDATPKPCCEPILDSVMSAAEADELATTIKALADPIRLRLVSIIAAAEEACACDFPDALGKSQPTVSHHLTLLVNAGILQREQRGKWAWFRVDKGRMEAIRLAIGTNCC